MSSLGTRIVGGPRNAFWIAAVIVTALDQLTKHILAAPGAQPHTIVPGFLRLVPSRPNVHGVFSLGPSMPMFYVLATLVGLGLITWFLVTTTAARRLPFMGLGCVTGGALGNLIDRLMQGAVRDFVDLHWLDQAHWPTFNIADTGICIGVAILIWESLRSGRQAGAGHQRHANGQTPDPNGQAMPKPQRNNQRPRAK